MDAHILLLSPLVSDASRADTLAETGEKWSPKIRKSAGFSGVKNSQNRKTAWCVAWEKTNIAINTGKYRNP